MYLLGTTYILSQFERKSSLDHIEILTVKMPENSTQNSAKTKKTNANETPGIEKNKSGKIQKKGKNTTMKFRNYVPNDEKLKNFVVPPVEIPKKAEEIDRSLGIVANKEPDLDLSIAPKKLNWDLKRDIEKKLEKLEIRTQRAIVEMMSINFFYFNQNWRRLNLTCFVGEKLNQNKKEDDWNQGYAAHTSKALEESDSEEEN